MQVCVKFLIFSLRTRDSIFFASGYSHEGRLNLEERATTTALAFMITHPFWILCSRTLNSTEVRAEAEGIFSVLQQPSHISAGFCWSFLCRVCSATKVHISADNQRSMIKHLFLGKNSTDTN